MKKPLLLLMFLCAFSLFLVLKSNALALDGSTFQAGNIISDSVFFNTSTMSVSDIQNFLNTQVGTCDTNGTQSRSYYYTASTGEVNNSVSGSWVTTTRAVYGQRYATWWNAQPTANQPNGYVTNESVAPYVCINTYVENPTTGQSNLQNPSASITGGQSSAQIIYNAAQQYGINPQVILVTLQKEQGLATDNWPWMEEYTEAMGYNCSDSARCSGYSSFYQQVSAAAWQFQDYGLNPQSFNYQSGQTSYILYSPNTSCGGTSVTIQNQATADLYNYTPYQPDQAALSNLYGTGDSCSSYGNRNFWQYFNTWFGSTTGDLVSTQGGGVYKIDYGTTETKQAFPNAITFLSYGYTWSDVTLVSSSELSLIPDGADIQYNVNYRDGHLVTSPSNGIYDIVNGVKMPFPNEGTFLSYGYTWSDALVISDLEMSLIPDGAAMPFNADHWDGHLVTSSSNGIYDIVNGVKMPFPNAITFLSYGYTWSDALVISDAELNLIPAGTAMTYNVNYRDGHLVTSPSNGIYDIVNGTKRPFPDETTFLSYGYTWSDALVISNAELNLIPDGVVMPMDN